MVESALYMLLLQPLFSEIGSSEDSGSLLASDITDLECLYKEIAAGNMTPDVVVPACFQKLECAVQQLTEELSNPSRTAKLWCQYLHYINVLRTFIRARELQTGICIY